MKKFLLYILFILVSFSSFAQGRRSQPKGNPNGLDTSAFSGVIYATRGLAIDDTFDAKTGNYINLKRKGVVLVYIDSNGVASIKKVLVNKTTLDIYDLDVNGTIRGTEYYVSGATLKMYSQGSINDNINIGRNNTMPTVFRNYIVGGENTNNGGSYSHIWGNGNSITTTVGGQKLIGHFNNIGSTGFDNLLFGVGCSITSGNTSGRVICIGNSNAVTHQYVAAVGNGITSYGNKEFNLYSTATNFVGGYENYWLGNGPQPKHTSVDAAVNVTIHGSGASTFSDNQLGGYTRLAAGTSNGNGVPPDVIFATADATTSGTTKQTLANRWWIKGETGTLSNVSSPPTNVVQYVSSTTQFGHSTPVMTTAQRNAISSPAAGDEVYCSDCTADDASTGVKQTYNGSTWKNHW